MSEESDRPDLLLILNKMLSEVRTKLERLRAQEASLCELRERGERIARKDTP